MSRRKFLADGMLGKLTRWLRILGYDVKYFRDNSDDELLKFAKDESRVLLTKDIGLYQMAVRFGVESILLNGSSLDEDLAILARRGFIELKIKSDSTRCPICNSKLKRCGVDEVSEIVPDKILKSSSHFWICPGCGKVYWVGSHWVSIRRRLEYVKRIIGSNG